MPTTDTTVRARIDRQTKQRAKEALEAMGLSVSEAIRLFMIRIADERRLPFEIKSPISVTVQAINDLESGQGEALETIEDLMMDLRKNN